MKGIITLLFLFISFSYNVCAHHGSASHFDNTKIVNVKGVITRFAFTNPHAFIYFDVPDANGNMIAWRCESTAAAAMKRIGWTKTTLQAGQTIEITGIAARREDNMCYANDIVVDGLAYDVRKTPPNATAISEEDVTKKRQAQFSARPATITNGQPNISGYWVRSRRQEKIEDGGYVATAAGKERHNNYDDRYESPALFCKPHNNLHSWGHDDHVNEVRQTEDAIHLTYGYMDFERTIHLHVSEHPDNIEPSQGGHSIGKWEGDTLVVDTIGFLPGVIYPATDIMYSDQMHTVERFRIDPATQELQRTYTVEDPLYLIGSNSRKDFHALSLEPYEPFGCENHNGANNSRPDK